MNLPKHAELWAPQYLADRTRHILRGGKPKRLWVAITDHYEPMGGRVSLDVAHARVRTWQDRWPPIAQAAPRDSSGNTPRYTFFYPQEEYVREILTALEPMCRANFADVEVHIHHDNDTAAGFVAKMQVFLRQLHEDHGFLHHHNGRLVFGFIHGNWALDNARPDGRWCGVTGELQLLRDLGCYADFTMPSLPSPTQGRILNQVYWTNGDPTKPRGFDRGTEAAVGGGRQGDLLMVTGPLGLRYRDRLMPRLEMGELAANDVPTKYRVQRWLDLAPRVGDDIFLKLFGHTAREDNAAALLGSATRPDTLGPMFHWLAEAAAERNLELHWATAFEMFQAIDALVKPAGAHDVASSSAARSAQNIPSTSTNDLSSRPERNGPIVSRSGETCSSAEPRTNLRSSAV
jgi:hypothetical protein